MLKATVKELNDICDALNLEVKASVIKANGEPRYMKIDYIRALQKHHLRVSFPKGNVPQNLLAALYLQDGPMLAARSTDLTPDELTNVWESSEWLFEEKWDGVRMWLVFVRGEGIHFYSRNLSMGTFCPCKYTNIHYTLDLQALGDFFESFVVDCELLCTSPSISTLLRNKGVVTETYLQAVTALLQLNDEESLQIQREQAPLYFRAFDVLMMNDNWGVKDMPLLKRIGGLSKIVAKLNELGLDIRPTSQITGKDEKRAFYDEIIGRGGEGVVAKHVTSEYIPGARKKTHWVKLKRSMSETLSREGRGDTIDGWISGFEPGTVGKAHEGKVGTILVSTYIEKDNGTKTPAVIASIAGLTDELRNDMSLTDDDGNLTLNPKYIGQVVEVDGQSVSARNKRLRHAKLIRFRPDKNAEDCSIEETFLNEMII